nr:unnamed protein product [Spirometra erinaceieuropaei]
MGCLSFLEKLIRRRSLSQDNDLSTDLKRCLTFANLLLCALSYTIGSGIFVLNGRLIKDIAGAATAVAYLVAGIPVCCTAACYAELATLIPRAGSAYSYTYVMLGELPAFLVGWTMISDIIVATAAIAKAFSGTVDGVSGYAISHWANTSLLTLPKTNYTETKPDLLAGLFILFLVLITLTGAKVSLSVNSVFSAIQVIGLVVLIIASFVAGQGKNITAEGGFAPFGVEGIFQAAGVVIFALSGFEIICNASEEAINPRRDVPRALGISLAIVIVLYVPATLGLAALVPRSQIVYASPYVDAFGRLGLPGLMWTSAIFTLLACGLTKLASVYALPRALYALARDGLLPNCFEHITPCNQQPTVSLLLSSSLIILLAIFLKIEVLADFMSIGVIFCYFIVGLDLIILRYLHGPAEVKERDEDGEEATLLTSRMPVRYLTLLKWSLTIPPRLQSHKAFKSLLSSYIFLILGLSLCIKFAFSAGLAGGFVLVGLFSFAAGVVVRAAKLDKTHAPGSAGHDVYQYAPLHNPDTVHLAAIHCLECLR